LFIDQAKVNQYPEIEVATVRGWYLCLAKQETMKKGCVMFMLALMLFSACGSKSYYQTKEGKRKLKYYNAIQFGQEPHPKKKF
jgi:hypothetical protein